MPTSDANGLVPLVLSQDAYMASLFPTLCIGKIGPFHIAFKLLFQGFKVLLEQDMLLSNIE